ncbi:MAG: protein-glutamate O-methyltransferase CheR [Polyangiaceae bacterium]|nr:protein-glutamate O-methyltransferase CheR [Polyangiaceae bacterium]
MNEVEFGRFQTLLRARSGIWLGKEQRETIAKKLSRRFASIGANTMEAYLAYLDQPTAEPEWDEVLELATIHETYFFRERGQLDAFVGKALPEIQSRAKQSNRNRLSIWSAGCSTGEELYSIAIMLRALEAPGWEYRYFGNDVSRRCVQTARKATYSKSSFRYTHEFDRYFEKKGDVRTVVESVRADCNFSHFNLLDEDRIRLLGRLDAIFCRNTFIYFDKDTRDRAVKLFWDRLLPGGYLFLGHSESLLLTEGPFQPVHLGQELAYRKVGGI